MENNKPSVSNIKPLGNRVLVERSKAKTSRGGIILPDSAQEKPREGVVVAVGPGKVNDNGQAESLSVKAGQKVLFGAYAGTEIKIQDDKEYLVMSEEDILGILS